MQTRFSVSDVKRITNCSRSNINYWRKTKLLNPEFSENGKNKKVYSIKDLFFIKLIKIFNDYGLFSIVPKIIKYLDTVMTGYDSIDYIQKIAKENWCLVLCKPKLNELTETCYLWQMTKDIKTPEILINGKNAHCIAGTPNDFQLIFNISNIAYNILQGGENEKKQ